MAHVAEAADVLDLQVVRGQSHANKFEEAAEPAKDCPEIAHLLPKPRKPWDSEPKTTVYFEALSLALTAIGGNEPDSRRLNEPHRLSPGVPEMVSDAPE